MLCYVIPAKQRTIARILFNIAFVYFYTHHTEETYVCLNITQPKINLMWNLNIPISKKYIYYKLWHLRPHLLLLVITFTFNFKIYWAIDAQFLKREGHVNNKNRLLLLHLHMCSYNYSCIFWLIICWLQSINFLILLQALLRIINVRLINM